MALSHRRRGSIRAREPARHTCTTVTSPRGLAAENGYSNRACDDRRDRVGRAGPGVRAPRAPVLLARPRARHLGLARRRAARCPKARSLASAVTGAGPGEVRVVCQGKLARRSPRVHQEGAPQGLPPAAEPSRKKLGDRRASEAPARSTAPSSGECEFKSVQARGERLGQQRPRRDHARPLHGAEVAARARERPALQPVLLQDDQSGALDAELRVPGDLPQRPEPDLRPGPRGRRASRSRRRDPNRHGIPEQELGACVRCNLQIEGSGARPEDVILDAGKNYLKPKRPGARPGGDETRRGVPLAPDGPRTRATPSTW